MPTPDPAEVREFHSSLLPADWVPTEREYIHADQGTAWWFDLSYNELYEILEPDE